MEEVYIPGDLVMGKDKPNVVWRVIGISSIADDDILYSVESLEDSSIRMYLYGFQLTPIELTPAILKNSGWETQNKWYYFLGINRYSIRYLGIDFEHKSPKGNLYVESNGDNIIEIQYCHQLQHLLFGLNLPMDLKV